MHKPTGLTGLASTMACLLLFCCQTSGLAQAKTRAKDVGLVTQVQGPASFLSAVTQKSSPVSPFMKIRPGDKITVENKSTVRAVYYHTGCQETWRGPANFRVGDGESHPLGKARPEVVQLHTHSATTVRELPALMRSRIGITRSGSSTNRSPLDKQIGSVPLAAQEKEELEEARRIYKESRAKAAADDMTPDICLATFLMVMEQYSEAGLIVDQALARQPEDTSLQKLKELLAEAPSADPGRAGID